MTESSTVTDEEWAEYKKQYNKAYDSDEDQVRRDIFVRRKQKIQEHNKKYEANEVIFSMSINQFTDMEFDEVCCGRNVKRLRKKKASKHKEH